MICDRCGRLLNRATGQCAVCADHGGNAPPPVATLEAAAGPDEAVSEGGSAAASPESRSFASVAATLRPAVPGSPDVPLPSVPGAAGEQDSQAEQPISVSAAVAILDLSDRPEKRPRSAKPSPPSEPPPPPRMPGAPFGVVRGGRIGGRRKVDLVAYDGTLVLARRGAPENLTSSQLAAQDTSSRVLVADAVQEAIVREDAVSGQARIKLTDGESVVVRWPGWKNRGVAAENLLAHAFPGKVDQGASEIVRRTVRLMLVLGIAMLLAVAAWVGLSALLEGDPPPPPPPAPTTTLPAAEQAARAELQAACPPWQAFASSVPAGERPDPAGLRPIADGMRGRFDAAAAAGADPSYATARDEVVYLQDYSRRPPDVVARESVSRVAYAMRTVSAACVKAV